MASATRVVKPIYVRTWNSGLDFIIASTLFHSLCVFEKKKVLVSDKLLNHLFPGMYLLISFFLFFFPPPGIKRDVLLILIVHGMLLDSYDYCALQGEVLVTKNE